MRKGGRQGFLPQAWWASKPLIPFTEIYWVILPKPTGFPEAHQTVLPCSALTKVREASPAPCHRSWGQPPGLGGHPGGLSRLRDWQAPHAWDSIAVSALARTPWIKTGDSETKAGLKRRLAGAVWFGSQVQSPSKSPENHSPATLIPTTPRVCSLVDHLGPPQHQRSSTMSHSSTCKGSGI